MNRERNYGIDALRIVSMLMVVLMHVLFFGGILSSKQLSGIQYLAAWTMEAACYCAVNCFALISGYVGVQTKPKAASIMVQWLQVVFYLAGFSLLLGALFPGRENASSWLSGFTPVTTRAYWYFSCYFVLCLIMPLLNFLLLSAPKKMLGKALALAAGCVIVLSWLGRRDLFGFARGYSVSWLVLLYLAGGYLRLYGKDIRAFSWLRRHGLWVFALCVILMGAASFAVSRAERPSLMTALLDRDCFIYSFMSPPACLCSMALFAVFSAWRPGKRMCRAIACLSPAAFGVYLIHLQPDVFSLVIENRFAQLATANVLVLMLMSFGAALVIYAACTAIELVRIRLFALLRIRRGCERLCTALAHILGYKEETAKL